MIFLPFGRQAKLELWATRDYPPKLLGGPRPFDDRDLYARIVGTEPPGDPLPDGPFRRVASAILDYRVFPLSVLTPVLAKTPVSVGDTVGLTYRLLPGLRMFVASRVIATFDEPTANGWKTGFTYRTLKGHAELGEEVFAVEKDRATGEVAASLTSWSRPGHWLTRLGYFYARSCQIHASHAALNHLEAIGKG